MHRVAFLFPPIVAGTLLLIYQNYEEWWAYLLMAIVADLILWSIMHWVVRTVEYLSGYAYDVQHHEPWVERVVHTETYTDSRGNTRTRTRVEYRHHPDRWLMTLNTGVEVDIASDTYHYYRMLWGTACEWINPPHFNCVSGGGGQLYGWSGVYEDAATHTYKGYYINYIANSRSIFRTEAIGKGDKATYGLVDYPKFRDNYLEQCVVLRSPTLKESITIDDSAQRAIHLVNAFAGEEHQIHIFIIAFDASVGITAALKQRDLWRGGNKNEFVVCLGVESEDGETTEPRVAWCKAFSWCDIPRLESATESYFLEHRSFDIVAYATWLRENLHLWQRKSFSDFAYLGIQLSPGRKALVWIATILLCALIAVIVYHTMTPPPSEYTPYEPDGFYY